MSASPIEEEKEFHMPDTAMASANSPADLPVDVLRIHTGQPDATSSPFVKSGLEKSRIILSKLCVVGFFLGAATIHSNWATGGLASGTFLLIGLSLALVGCLGRVWCSLFIDGFKTKELVTCGPYSVCRNPLYFFSAVGAIGVAFGSATLAGPVVVSLCFAAYYPAIIKAEERRLVQIHGDSFREYCQNVPAFFPHWGAAKTPETYQIQTRLVMHSMVEATWFVWLTMLVHLLYQLHQRTDFLPTLFNSF